HIGADKSSATDGASMVACCLRSTEATAQPNGPVGVRRALGRAGYLDTLEIDTEIYSERPRRVPMRSGVEAEDDRNGGQRGRESAIGTHVSGLIKDKVGARRGQDRASDTVVKLSNLIAVRAATERYNSNHGEISHYLLRRKSIAGICEWSDHSYFGVRSVVRTSRSPLLDGFLSGLLLRALRQHSNGAIGDFLWHHRPRGRRSRPGREPPPWPAHL
ncbi:hypothetical protein THAOC_25053, partial [Thalassiosira oceanica]